MHSLGDTEHPEFQLGEGCLVDQLVGQYLAQVAGLGFLLDRQNVVKTLQSIYKYNYKRVLYDHESVARTFALNDEAALVICDYSHGKRPRTPFPYFQEVMTGFEYSAAILMLYVGMMAEGVELIENIRRRYDGKRRNPWDEAECGFHYARPMASWSALLALSGFRYDGKNQTIEAKPRVDSTNFSSFWSTGLGWGTFSIMTANSRREFALSVLGGRMACQRVLLSAGSASAPGKSSIKIGTRSIPHQLQHDRNEVRIVFPDGLELNRGDRLVALL